VPLGFVVWAGVNREGIDICLANEVCVMLAEG